MLKAFNDHSDMLKNFGSDRLDEELILSAEKFLVKVIAPKKLSNFETFDDLRVKLHRQSMVKKYVDLPCTSISLRENIKRAYLHFTDKNMEGSPIWVCW